MTTFLKPLIGGVLLAGVLAACGGGSGGGSGRVLPGTTEPTATTPPAGDSSAGSSTGSPSGASPTAPGGLTLAQQIETLERKGNYPVLDRSSDIAGPDTNKNGVRDDIEAWINAQPVTEPQRKALMQDARATQQTLIVDLTDKEALQRAGEGLAASSHCGLLQFSPYAVFSKLSGKIEAMTANTRERAMRYMEYNKARSGTSTTSPRGDTCEP